ncbi:MAG: vWA domain-containing protein [Spirochaetota bacterium]
MSFANPLGLLLLLAIPVIVVLHLFRQERRRREVSSLYLWREISDQHSRRMRPRLLRNVNLLLQLIAALLASLALAQPIVETTATTGSREIVVLIDDSASMQSSAGGVSRMELARNRAREIVGRAPRNSRVMILTAGPRPTVLQTFTADRTALYETIRDLHATDGPNDLARAVALVRGLAPGPDAEVVFVTDGSVSPDALAEIPHPVRLATVGTPEQADGENRAPTNRAITSFELRERPDGSAFEVLSAVANYSPDPAAVTYRLAADAELVSEQSLDLEPGEERLVTAVIPRTRGTVYTGELVDNDDALDVDDRAFAAASGQRPVRIQLVTPGNLFLESFLAVYPDVQLTIAESVNQDSPFDILILDQVPAPARLRGNVVAFGSALPDGPFTQTDTRELEQTVSVRASHPILEGVQLNQIRVGRYAVGELNPRATVLAAAGDAPLLYTYRRDRLTLVATTFGLGGSDIALRGSFPVLMNNIVEWLAPVAPTGEVGYASVGSAVPLYVPPGEEVVVVRPDGTAVRATPRTSPFEFTRTDQTGVYEVRGESFRSRFAVTLADARESDLANRLGSATRTEGRDTAVQAADHPVWHWIALLALLVLVADWIVWARRH